MIVGGIFAVATFIASWLAQFTGLVAVQLIALGAGFVCFVDAALGFGDLGPGFGRSPRVRRPSKRCSDRSSSPSWLHAWSACT